jgi:hypothetical protein
VSSERRSIEEHSIEYCGWACARTMPLDTTQFLKGSLRDVFIIRSVLKG